MQKNIQLKHDEVANDSTNVTSPKLSSKEDNSDNVESKLGRNDKVELISPSGEKIKVKFKKIDQYLMKGYTRV